MTTPENRNDPFDVQDLEVWNDFCRAVVALQVTDPTTGQPVDINNIKPAIVGQAILESGKGKEPPAQGGRNNFWGLKWRSDIHAPFPLGKFHHNAGDGWYDYCTFRTIEEALQGYWLFIHRYPYKGIDKHLNFSADFLQFLGQPPSAMSFCPPGYTTAWIRKHQGKNYHQYILDLCVPEAERDLRRYGWEYIPIPPGGPVHTSWVDDRGMLWLEGVQVPFYPSPYHASYVSKPTCGVLHSTGGMGKSPLEEDVRNGLIAWFLGKTKEKSKDSPQLLIFRNGLLVQLVSFFRPAWHAGSAFWNMRSWGIELENFGWSATARLGRVWRGLKSVPQSECVQMTLPSMPKTPLWWHNFSDEQYATLNLILPVLQRDLPPGTLYGHGDVLPEREGDPGPQLDWWRLVNVTLGHIVS